MSQSSELRSAVTAQNKGRRTGIVIAVIVAVIAVVAIVIGVSVASANNQAAPATDERRSVKIVTATDANYVDVIVEVAAEKGLDVEFTNVEDWVLPNTEVVAGNFDANSFQHILYLSNFNVANDQDLVPVFSTTITTWGIFSATLDAVADIPDGGRIVIPDDPSNGGRALFILQSAGLIELDPAAGTFPTFDDITANPKNLEFVSIAALTIPQQFDDPSIDAVVVGTNYFDPSQGITTEDALFFTPADDPSNLPYVGAIVTRADNADDPAWAILEQVYRDSRVIDAITEEYGGSIVLVDIPIEDLRAKLAELEKEAAEL